MRFYFIAILFVFINLFSCKTEDKTELKTADETIKDTRNLVSEAHREIGPMNITYTLGSVYYTQLGQYQTENEPAYFTDENIHPHLETFQNRLEEIETIIQDRNAVRPTPYGFLLPSRIPQSINI